MAKLKHKARDKHTFISTDEHELPSSLKKQLNKAKRLEWLTIAYLITVIIIIYLTLGSSQAMKAAWFEDMLSLIPAICFLIAYSIFDRKPPDHQFLYGYHKVFSVAYLMGAFALLSIGLFTFYDSLMALIKQEHPTIGPRKIFGEMIWMGWIMIAALLWSFIPAVFLGRAKLPIAKKLHNKILITDANTQKADWETAAAAIVGIIGVGFGFWWADSVAALFISANIVYDGFKRTRGSIFDIMEQIPTRIDNDSEKHPLDYKIHDHLNGLNWIEDVRVRLRENGQVFFGEAYIIPKTGLSGNQLILNIEKANQEIRELDWKVHDITIQPVRGFDELEKEGKNAQDKIKK